MDTSLGTSHIRFTATASTLNWRSSLPAALIAGLTLAAGACGPPVEEEELPPEGETIEPEETWEPEGPLLEAPGGAYLDLQCGGKHQRHPIRSITHRGARFVKSGGTETFEHLDTSCNRVEVDTNDHYKTGRHVFEGDVRIGRVTGQSVVQIFDATSSGPIMMIKAYSSGGGTLRKLAGSVTLATGVSDKWVRIRIVHDLGPNTMTIDVNGDRKWSGSGGRGGGFNLKYGNYGTGAPTDVQWRNASW